MAAAVWVGIANLFNLFNLFCQVWIANLFIALCVLAPVGAAAWGVVYVLRFARALLREAVTPSAWLGGRGRGRVTRRKQA